MSDDHLTLLGSQSSFFTNPDDARLESFPNRGTRPYTITLDTHEFSSLCPVTGQPDSCHLTITYVPAEKCVETKSLKYYLASYRNYPAFNEQIVNRITDDLVHVLGDLAAWADYPEEDLPEVQPDHLEAGIQHILEELQATLDTYSYGKILREGVSAVIVGKPNVGKSTLFNLLSGCQRSIVTEIAGTTRDMVEERIRLGNVTLRLIDTAGLRETEDVIEQIGVSIAREQVQQADLILAVFDATRALDAEDLAMMEQIQGRTVLAIVNKTDGVPVLNTEKLEQTFDQVLYLSAKEGTGLESLRQAVETLFYTGSVTPEMGIVANERQRGCLLTAREQVLQALEALHAGEFLDGITVLLDEAAQALLTLTGERVSEAVVNDVFARFCVGK